MNGLVDLSKAHFQKLASCNNKAENEKICIRIGTQFLSKYFHVFQMETFYSAIFIQATFILDLV